MSAEEHKALVRRFVEEVLGRGDFAALNALAATECVDHADAPDPAALAQFLVPWRAAFPDLAITIEDLLAEGDRVAAHFRCSGTHLGTWRGHAPTGCRFEDVDEVYFFRLRDGRLSGVDAVLEDDLGRMEQLGLYAPAAKASASS